ncbi:MAG TPA: HAD family hydrolase [Actinomycetota bacterium]|nr:HAD family hydrolase [Actinomycetota bacterium]
MNEVRAVLLDLYDTLAWTEWPTLRAELEERFGIGEAQLLRAFTTTREARSVGAYADAEGDLAAVLEAAGVSADPAVVRELHEARMRAFVEHGVHLWDDSVPTLRELRARGVRTAIVSNCDHATRPIVDGLGLPRETDAVVLSFEVGVAKPHAGIYRAALDALEARPEETVFVDDQAAYCEGAETLGIRSFLMLREDAEPAEGVSVPRGRSVLRDLRSLLDAV